MFDELDAIPDVNSYIHCSNCGRKTDFEQYLERQSRCSSCGKRTTCTLKIEEIIPETAKSVLSKILLVLEKDSIAYGPDKSEQQRLQACLKEIKRLQDREDTLARLLVVLEDDDATNS